MIEVIYMDTITLPKKEYQKLMEKALLYEYLAKIIKKQEDIFACPPTKKTKEIIKEFKATGLYGASFINDMEKGLKRSSYFSD